MQVGDFLQVYIENDGYNYQTGVYYMDVVAELERIGDFIINISQAEEEMSRQ